MRVTKLFSIIPVVLFIMIGTYAYSGNAGHDSSGSGYLGVSTKASPSRSESADSHMVGVVPITEVFADGCTVGHYG